MAGARSAPARPRSGGNGPADERPRCGRPAGHGRWRWPTWGAYRARRAKAAAGVGGPNGSIGPKRSGDVGLWVSPSGASRRRWGAGSSRWRGRWRVGGRATVTAGWRWEVGTVRGRPGVFRLEVELRRAVGRRLRGLCGGRAVRATGRVKAAELPPGSNRLSQTNRVTPASVRRRAPMFYRSSSLRV